MTDVVTPEVRSRMMASIKGKNTKPETALRRMLHARGLRYRLNCRHLSGSPDIVFPRWHTVVFVHGCFWHRHLGCKMATVPKTRQGFWENKFDENVARDLRNETALLDAGWRVAVVWGCRIGREPSDDLIDEVVDFIRSGDRPRLEIG